MKEEEIKLFLQEYPDALVRVVTTIKPGYVAFIKPVPRLFGPEIHCRAEDEQTIKKVYGHDNENKE